MKIVKPALLLGVWMLIVALACQSSAQVAPTATALPPTALPSSTPIPATETPLPSPTVEKPAMDFPSRIAYSLFPEGEGIYIHTVNADGSNDVRLSGNDCLGALPVWSMDGSKIAHYCYDSDGNKANLWVMNADGSGAHFVAVLPDLMFFRWAPDNEHIVYHAPQPNGSENDIYVLDLNSGRINNLTSNSPVWDAFPVWSPMGDQIAFVSDRAEGGKSLDDVWTMNADGSSPVNLTNNGELWEDDYPAWSPDGSQIAFFRTNSLFSEDVPGGPAGLWVMDADGGNPRLVIALDGFRFPGPPVWSPDARSIAYADGLDDSQNIWVVPSAGGDALQLSSMPGSKSHISWSPDSQALIFTNDYDTDDSLLIYIALADGSDTRVLMDHEHFGFGDWAP